MRPEDFTLVEAAPDPADFVPASEADIREAKRKRLVDEMGQVRQEAIAQQSPGKTQPGGVLDQVGIGLTQGFAQLGQAANRVIAESARNKLAPVWWIPGASEWGAEQFGGAAQVAGRASRELEQLGQSTQGPDLVRQVAAGAVSTVPSMVVAPAGLPAAAFVAGLQSFGGTMDEAQQAYQAQGLDEASARRKAYAPALASGVVTALVTASFGKTGIENWTEVFQGQGWKPIAKSIAKESGFEAGEEWWDQVGQSVVRELSFDPSRNTTEALARAFEESAQAGLAGGLAAGGLKGISLAGQRGAPPAPPAVTVAPPSNLDPGQTPPVIPPAPSLMPPGSHLVWNVNGQVVSAGPFGPDVDLAKQREQITRTLPSSAEFVGIMENPAPPAAPAAPEPAPTTTPPPAPPAPASAVAELPVAAPEPAAEVTAPPAAIAPPATAAASKPAPAAPSQDPDDYTKLADDIADDVHRGKTDVAARVGDRIIIMGVPSVVERTETVGGVRYDLFRNASQSIMDQAAIRVTDVDSGETVTLKQFPVFPAASAAYETALRKAKDDADPATAVPEPTGAPAAQAEPPSQDPADYTKAEEAETPAPAPEPTIEADQADAATVPAAGSNQLADWVRDSIRAGTPISWQQLFTQADRAFGGTQSQGRYTVKDAYDAMELGINRWILLSQPISVDPLVAIQQLKAVIGSLPTQTKRTEEQDEFQQFSTVPPLAFVVNWVANTTVRDTVLEPSAGLGGLAVFARRSGAKVVVNELSPRRLELLKQLPFDGFFSENAEHINRVLPEHVRPTVVLMNPPFSATAGRQRGQRKTINATMHLEQALRRMAPGGRLVAIVGEGMAMDRPTFREWWAKIRKEYNVRANVGISGDEYRKYGTAFDNQILVIDKDGPTKAEPITGKVSEIESLVSLLEGVRNERPVATQSAPSQPAQSGIVEPSQGQAGPEPAVSPATDAVGSGVRGAVSQPEVSPGAGGDIGQPGTNAGPGVGPSIPGGDGRRSGGESAVGVPGDTGAGGSGGAAVGGAPHDAGGQVGGVSYSVALESPAAEPEESGDERVYEDYRPQIQVGQAKPHPTPLAESAAMSAVTTPTPTYQPKLPAEVVQQGNLSGPQLESVILAGQAHGQTLPDGSRKGFFIGDGTGVGKGREIAAILWDNWNHGRRKAVWITEKAELVDDAGRDMEGVGWTRAPLFEVSKVKSGEPIKNKDGIAFITYDTLRAGRHADKNAKAEESQGKGELARLKQLVAWLGPDFDGVIAFDEAHNMGNAIEIRGKRGKKKPSRKALAGVQLQQQLPKARIVYVSATGATEVSNLSYAGRLGLWGEGTPFSGINQFVSEIAAGGVAAMELVAQSMKSMGLYLARTLNFKGVTYDQIDHGLSPEQKEVYDELAGAWQIVLQNIVSALGMTGQQNNPNAKSGVMSAFWGNHQRFFNQIVTALGMPAVISRMEKYIAQGDAVVLQLVNTYEAATERQLARKREEGGELDLESLDLTPREQLMQMVERAFPVNQFEPVTDEHGNTKWVLVTDSAGNPVQNEEAVAMRDALLSRLGAIRVPEAPLDMIVNTFGADQVAEVTGRKRRIVYVERDGSRFKEIEKRSDSKAKADADAFMADQKRVLIFSEKGGTGRSYHADRKAKNQRKRRHILLRAGWRADKAIQGFGRTHRSNQVHAPEYVMVRIPEIPGQARFISSIARRLDQLGALTKGQRQTGGQGFFSARDNLESDYAKDALLLLFRSIASGEASVGLEDFQAQTGLQLVDENGNLGDDLPPITQFLNRLLSMKLDAQNKVFDDFMTRFEGIIKAEMEAGTFDQGLETLRAQRIEVLQDKEVYRHPDTGATARYVELDLEHPTKITPWNQVRSRTKFGFVLNRQSGKVWAVTHRTERTAKDGSLYVEYRVESPTTANYVAAERMTDEHYEKLDEARAAKEWESAARSAPKTYRERRHLVSGTILPIWNRIKGKPKIVRVVARDGRKYLGRLIDSGRLSEVLEALGAEARASSIEPESALESVLDRGAQITLANGWRMVRRKVSGDLRIEIVGVGLSDMNLLRTQGAIIERINWETRFFLPTGDSMLEVFKRVSLGKPIMSVEEPRLRAGLPSDPAPTDVDNSANRARHALDGGGMQINPGGNPEAGFVVNPAQLIADLAKVGVDLFNRGASTFAGWSRAMLNLFGRKVKPWLIRVWDRVTNLTRATLAGLTPEGVATVNRIEAQGDQASQPAIRPVYPDGRRDNFWRKAGRPSRRLAYFGSAALLRSKQELDLEESYQSAAVKSASDRLMAQLERSAYDAQPTAWKLPRWMRTGAWARRLRLFKRLALPIAAHLNVTGRNPAGEFVFSDFEMRSGLMTVREFVRGKHTVGAVITVDNPLTGASEEMTIGNLVTLPNGRSGYQLTRQMTATQQAELYRHYADEFPEMMWLLDMYVDPDLAGVRQTVNGVQVPLFNRFSQAAMMGDTDPRFQAVEAYTPDVLVARSLMGAVRGALGLRRGTRSPGRRYKTGASRESGGVRDLLSGHNVRTFQMLQERARRQFFQAILRTAAPIPGGVVPEGFVKLDLGMEELWQAVKRLRFWRSPRDPVTGALLFPETESRLGDDNSPEYRAFFGEAASLRGRQLMISQALLDTLLRKYAAHQTHGMLYRMGAWLVRNSTQLFLAHPKTYAANVLTNDLFAFEAAYRHAIAGLVKLDARDLRYASGILAGMVLNRFKGLRELIHVADNTRYMRTVREVLPDQIFSDATQLSDVKVRYDDNWFDLLRRGELGGATLQIIHYGAIDVRAKQRMAYAYLRATAITNARRAGLRGRAHRAAVDGYMANPPMEDRARAVASANFELLNYSDSPDWLNRFSRSDYGRLVLPFPRFGYHYLAKQKSRLEAVRLLIGRVPQGQRADAFADLVTVATFGLGGAGLVFSTALRALLDLPDDEDTRQHVGTSTVRFVDEDGRVKTKVIDRELVTSNRVNLSYWARAMGLDTGQDDDFWLRTRQYPVISMAGAAALAIDDARKFGPQYGVATYASTVGDLAGDFFSVGMALKIPDKALASMRSLGTGRPEKPILDPYATNVPFLAYMAEQAVDSLLPGSRQVDEVIWWLDPMVRRKTASSTLDFYPGVWDGLRAGHVTGLIDRLLSEGQSTLPPAGEIDRSAGAVADPREIPVATRVLSLGGFNVKPIDRAEYEEALAR